VMFHSCGSIAPLIPYLIELVVDIIDPVQTTARNMDPQWLHDKFGNDVVFHGDIDTQRVLPAGNTKHIKKHAIETIKIFGGNGGYIFAPCNNIQSDTPMESIVALYRAAIM
jgi:uroporphyrinogen decarboxylase